MTVAAIVMSCLLALVFVFVGAAKIVRQQRMVESAEHLGFSSRAYQVIGTLEVAGAAGLVGGIYWPPLGIAAAAGLFLLMVGAVATHVRTGDGPKIFLPAAWLGLVSAVTGVIIILAH